MGGTPSTGGTKKNTIALTVGSKIRVRSASSENESLVSNGAFRGLVSIGGDSSLAVELDGSVAEEKGRIRLIPLNAVLALDVLEAAKVEEEKRADPASPGYFG
ncbi:MAG TPA: hypothetical protein VKT21_03660 [Thermoplasmata archaeon]|nr:hypothetical protein [Thermoplasmata archaeon]